MVGLIFECFIYNKQAHCVGKCVAESVVLWSIAFLLCLLEKCVLKEI